MTPAQYRGVRAHLGLTQVGAARLLTVDDWTSRHWAQKGLSDGPADMLWLTGWTKTIPRG